MTVLFMDIANTEYIIALFETSVVSSVNLNVQCHEFLVTHYEYLDRYIYAICDFTNHHLKANSIQDIYQSINPLQVG